MEDIFAKIKNIKENWFSQTLGSANGNPVSIRVMIDKTARFHKHESDDEMFIVLSGTLFIDIKNTYSTAQETTHYDMPYKSIELTSGESFTVESGIEHRTRVIGRAELIVIGGAKV